MHIEKVTQFFYLSKTSFCQVTCRDEAEYLDEADQAHAEENVQVAAEFAEQRLPAHARLLQRLLVGQRGVANAQSEHVARIIVDFLVGQLSGEAARHTLSRTQIDAVARDEIFGGEHVVVELVGALGPGVQAIVVATNGHIGPEVDAAAVFGQQLLEANVEATLARVLDVLDAGQALEYVRVGQRLEERVRLVHCALAVGERPLVELLVDEGRRLEGDLEAGGELEAVVGQADEIGGEVVYPHDEHLVGVEEGERVGQADVELDAQLVAGREDFLGGDGPTRGRVDARVEADAVEPIGVEDGDEVLGEAARLAPERAADDHSLQVGHVLLLGEAQIAPALVFHITLELEQHIILVILQCGIRFV